MSVASKAESQEICFVAQNDYRGFIDRYAATNEEEAAWWALVSLVRWCSGTQRTALLAHWRQGHVAAIDSLPKPGPIYDQEGKLLGRHRGLAYYTIGQRKGLGLTSPEPLHVLKIDAQENALIVGPASALEQTALPSARCTMSAARCRRAF